MKALVRVLAVGVLVALGVLGALELRSRLARGAGPVVAPPPTAAVPDPIPARRPAFAAAPGGERGEAVGAADGRTSSARRARNERAIAALEQGDYEAAVQLFEQCHAEAPAVEVFARNLAEALARLAAREHESADEELRARALERLSRAVQLHPERDDLADLLARWRRTAEAEQDFWRKLTDHFELSFDGTREELMAGTAPLELELERAYHEFGDAFGAYPVEDGRPRIRVVLYRRAAFDSVTGLGDWAAGVFDGTVRVPVTDLAREGEHLVQVLRHELMHAFVQEMGGAQVPGWLNEGLAQLYEAPSPAGRRATVDAARRKLADQTLFSLERLRGSLASWSDTAEIELAYAQSVAFVAFVERMYGERVLFEMVTGCKAARTPEQVFRARIGDGLERVLVDFLAARD
ncbi:MAG: hypothetical protein E2O39_08200 [Planctomycetota bacterium]|nr:MAG: hypothetical protein E2O39_08200 [Planctomycetota bacterium]